MAADLRSEKVAHTFYPFGYYFKPPDAGWRDIAHKEMQAQPEPGRADAQLWPIPPGPGHWIEIKNGTGKHKERFAFDQWAERQRLFCIASAFSGYAYWIFLMMGTAIGATDYPLVAFLLPGEQMFELEWMAAGRKSLSYKTALALLQPLTWVPGQDRWAIPPGHSFRSLVEDNRHGHCDCHRALCADGQARGLDSAHAPEAPPNQIPVCQPTAELCQPSFEAAAAFYPGADS